MAFVLSATLSFLAIVVLRSFAPRLGLIDRPGGRKTHLAPIPLVGGLGILAAVVVGIQVYDLGSGSAHLAAALFLIAAVGAWDDAADIRPRIKFAAQILAGALMIWGAGVQLNTVGDLLGWRPLGLGALAAPITLFALVGVINAINMLDGMDGLAGLCSLQAFLWYAAVAADSGLGSQTLLALLFAGATAGFLALNGPFPGRSRALAFLGDAGSLLLGFALAWLAIDLTQGAGRTFPPIAALWVLLLPLADCVSLMTRRIRSGRSPFVADREHIHHYLIARGFSSREATWLLAGIATLFGAVGYFGWKLAVPEPLLFWTFFVGYFAYHFWARHAWKRVQ